MGKSDPRVDAYIAKSADFARPILEYLREIVHEGCPDAEEAIKWGFPNFMHRGMLCNMAAFKAHCTFGFWKGAEVVGGDAAEEKAMGQFGRITSISDLPPRAELLDYVRKAAALNEAAPNTKATSTRPKAKKKPIPVPDDLKAALAENPAAMATFEGFSPSARRDYLEWITGAKREETRTRRLATAVEWMAEGKPRNWKYMK